MLGLLLESLAGNNRSKRSETHTHTEVEEKNRNNVSGGAPTSRAHGYMFKSSCVVAAAADCRP